MRRTLLVTGSSGLPGSDVCTYFTHKLGYDLCRSGCFLKRTTAIIGSCDAALADFLVCGERDVGPSSDHDCEGHDLFRGRDDLHSFSHACFAPLEKSRRHAPGRTVCVSLQLSKYAGALRKAAAFAAVSIALVAFGVSLGAAVFRRRRPVGLADCARRDRCRNVARAASHSPNRNHSW